jgi:SAM-dependent methyltransferase
VQKDFLVPQRRNDVEWLDHPEALMDDLAANLGDIRFLNRWFGGTDLAWRGVRLLRENELRMDLLDLCTGSADIPIALCDRAKRSEWFINAVGLDSSPEVLAEARRATVGYPVELVHGDARELAWPDDSFDIVMCCLALHHFQPDDASRVLHEMWRTCRVGLVVTDLVRGPSAYAGAWLVTRTLARNRVTRHDGPLSVLRAYTPSELRHLALVAGIPNARVRRYPFFRQLLVARKAGPRHAN